MDLGVLLGTLWLFDFCKGLGLLVDFFSAFALNDLNKLFLGEALVVLLT